MATEIYTAADAALELGCAPSTVARRAETHSIGRRHGRQWIFTRGDLAKLRRVIRDGPGNPTFGAQAGDY